MSTKVPLVIQGRSISRTRASFLLFQETFRFLWTDKEILWVPIITLILQLIVVGVAVAVSVLTGFIPTVETEVMSSSETVVLVVAGLLFYTVSAFIMVCAEAVITHIVYVRAHNGNATLSEGIHTAVAHATALFVWALITSTVGLILRLVAERSAVMVKIVVAIMGTAWSVLTFFVVPAIIIDRKSSTEAISHSGSVFKRTWGETIVTNVSFGLAFFVFFVLLILLIAGTLFVSGGNVIVSLVCGVVFIVAMIGSMILSVVLGSVLKTLLYMYASEHMTPTNFNSELLEVILARRVESVERVQPGGV